MKNILALLILMVLVLSCKQSNMDYVAVNNSVKVEHPGKKLMETHCYSCHNPDTPHDSRLAPPMVAIKRHYITGNLSKEQFKLDIQAWVKNPSEELSKMPGAINKFGLMPYVTYPEDIIELISDYIYDNTIEKPKWFEEHYQNQHKKGARKKKQ